MVFKKLLHAGVIAAMPLALGLGSVPSLAQQVQNTSQQAFQPTFVKAKDPARMPSDIQGFEAGEYQKTEDVMLLGKNYSLTFWQMPETAMTWDDAKKYLPAVATQAPKNQQNVPDQDLLVYISKLAVQASLNYDAYAQQDFAAKKQQYMAQHPGLPEETVSVLIYEQYHGNNGWQYSKQAQEAHNTYLALTYVEDALRLKMGYIEKKPTN